MNLPLHIDDLYHTPENTPRLWLDRLLPCLQLAFKWKFIGIVIKARRLCRKGLYDDEAWASTSYDNFHLLEKSGARFHISGLENLKKVNGPAVIISNHMSTLETMVFPFLIAQHKKVTFVVKESLVRHRIFGPIMRSRNPISVSRQNSREDLVEVLTQGQKLLSEGCSIVIFPQSTRRIEFIPSEFNSLGAKLAAKAGVPVIPVAIKTDFWLNGKIIKDLGALDLSKPIHIKFGEPMQVKGTGKDENNQIIRFIQSNLEKWNEAIRD